MTDENLNNKDALNKENVEESKDNKKKNLIIAGVIALIAVVGIGGYVWMNQNQDKLIPKEDIVYELGDKVDLDAKNFLDEKMSKDAIKETKLTSDLMTDTKKYTFDKKTNEVVTKDKKFLDVGKYEVNLSYKKDNKDVEFSVKDTTAPEFKDFLAEINVEKDAENVDLKKYFEASDLSDFEISINQGKFDVSKEGDYSITVTATDEYKNKAEKKSTVHVLSAEEAQKEGLTKDNDGNMALSKETKSEVESGKTTIKESEDVIDNSKPSTGNGSNNSNSGNSGNTGNSGNEGNSGNSGGSSNNKPEHKHNWVAQYTTVHHEEQGHNEQYVIKEAWTEQVPVYETQARTICNTCGADITGNVAPHIENHMLNGENGSYRTEYMQVQVGTETIEHPAEYGTKWVVDQPAYDEKVLTGYTCSCGQTKPKD